MKVSLNIYGDQAKTLEKELCLGCNNKNVTVPMSAHFSYRAVLGRTVVAAEFTSTEPADCTGNEEREAAFQKVERRFDVSRELRGY